VQADLVLTSPAVPDADRPLAGGRHHLVSVGGFGRNQRSGLFRVSPSAIQQTLEAIDK
jgi:hypothetical protein